MDWKKVVLDEAQNSPAQTAVLMVNADTGEEMLSLRKEERMVSASTIKVAIMLTVLDAVQKGELTLDHQIHIPDEFILDDSTVFEYGAQSMSVDALIKWMIILSDNTATNALIRLMGMERINDYCLSIGLKNSRVERVMLDFAAVERGLNNYTSAQDQCDMFLKLYHQSILTPQLCEYALSVLLGQRWKDDLMRYIPDDVKVAHKTGSLDNLDHDSALFYLNGIRFYLGVFVWDAPDNRHAQQLIGRIGKRVYDEFK